MNYKHNVELTGPNGEKLSPVWDEACPIIESVFEKHGFDCTVTSAFDGKHMASSLHYRGLALDFRTHHLGPSQDQVIADEIRAALTKDFDVVVEDDHLHIEHDVKD